MHPESTGCFLDFVDSSIDGTQMLILGLHDLASPQYGRESIFGYIVSLAQGQRVKYSQTKVVFSSQVITPVLSSSPKDVGECTLYGRKVENVLIPLCR
jgi:hypothetical protein